MTLTPADLEAIRTIVREESAPKNVVAPCACSDDDVIVSSVSAEATAQHPPMPADVRMLFEEARAIGSVTLMNLILSGNIPSEAWMEDARKYAMKRWYPECVSLPVFHLVEPGENAAQGVGEVDPGLDANDAPAFLAEH